MSRLLAIVLLGWWLIPADGVCADANELRTYIDGVVTHAMQRDAIAGVSVAVVDRSGVLFTKGYGVAALEPTRAMDADTLCRVGSISKTLVWIAIMQLVEQGKLQLDDPINQHLPPALRIPDEGFSEPIRIRHLMTHSAGFEETVLGHMEVKEAKNELPLATYLARYRPHRVRPPGELAVYSNYSAALAGVIVAYTSGMSWEDYAEIRILRPLGMLTSTFREAIPPELARQHGLPKPASAALASLMSAGFHWQNGRVEEAPPEFITHFAPAGALAASANDMSRYMQALLDPDGLVRAGVLDAQTVHTMRQPSFANAKGFGTIYHGFWQFPFPGSRSAFGHDGDTGYQHSIMMIIPDVGVGIFASVNTSSGLRLIEQLPYLVGLHLQGQNPPQTAVEKSDAPGRSASAALAGSYRAFRRAYYRTERFFLNFVTASVEATPDGDLLVSGLSEEEVVRYRPLGHDEYQELTGLRRIAFRHSGSDLLLLDPTGSNPLERMTFWQGPVWLALIAALAHVVALWGSIQLLRNGLSALRILSLTWLVAFVLAWIGVVPWLSNSTSLIIDYPGVVFPIACWLFLVAALGTVGVVAVMIWMRPAGWPRLHWAGTGAAVLIFACCAITLRYWGLLGFSGW